MLLTGGLDADDGARVTLYGTMELPDAAIPLIPHDRTTICERFFSTFGNAIDGIGRGLSTNVGSTVSKLAIFLTAPFSGITGLPSGDHLTRILSRMGMKPARLVGAISGYGGVLTFGAFNTDASTETMKYIITHPREGIPAFLLGSLCAIPNIEYGRSGVVKILGAGIIATVSWCICGFVGIGGANALGLSNLSECFRGQRRITGKKKQVILYAVSVALAGLTNAGPMGFAILERENLLERIITAITAIPMIFLYGANLYKFINPLETNQQSEQVVPRRTIPRVERIFYYSFAAMGVLAVTSAALAQAGTNEDFAEQYILTDPNSMAQQIPSLICAGITAILAQIFWTRSAATTMGDFGAGLYNKVSSGVSAAYNGIGNACGNVWGRIRNSGIWVRGNRNQEDEQV